MNGKLAWMEAEELFNSKKLKALFCFTFSQNSISSLFFCSCYASARKFIVANVQQPFRGCEWLEQQQYQPLSIWALSRSRRLEPTTGISSSCCCALQLQQNRFDDDVTAVCFLCLYEHENGGHYFFALLARKQSFQASC